MKKGTKLFSIINQKCPKCHERDLFENKLYSFKSLLKMKEKCENCDQIYELEPGFYWGSMYIAYGVSSGIMLGTFVVLHFLLGWSMNASYAAICLVILIMIPVVFRISRALWINLYVSYDPKQLSDDA